MAKATTKVAPEKAATKTKSLRGKDSTKKTSKTAVAEKEPKSAKKGKAKPSVKAPAKTTKAAKESARTPVKTAGKKTGK